MRPKKPNKWILYSTCDEDSDSEMRALDIVEGDDVLSVTGSGCRTLSLASNNPRSVVSVDISPGQSHLLELKLAAIRHFSYDSLLGFLGVEPCQDRWALFTELRPKLSREAYDYFASYLRTIKRGVLLTGRHEKFYTRIVAPSMKVLYGGAVRALFEARTIEEQRAIYRERIDGRMWRFMFRSGFLERIVRMVLNDPNYRVTIDVDSVGAYVLDRIDHTFMSHLARDNHWVTFMLTGKYSDRERLPHYLLRGNYDAIRAADTDVQIVTDDLIDFVRRSPDCSFDKFSLSDVTSCIDREQFAMLMKEVARVARHGGRVCYRNFLAKYQVPDVWQSTLRRDEALSSVLTRDDKAFIYDFEVLGVIAGADGRE